MERSLTLRAAPKRISPFHNTPKQRKEEKRWILRISCMKLRKIEDPEQCLWRSVVVHNTAKQMERELSEDGAAYVSCWDTLGFSKWGKSEQIICKVSKSKQYQYSRLSCEFNLLNSSYLYANAHLFIDNMQHERELEADELSKALERTVDNYKSNIDNVNSESQNSVSTTRTTTSNFNCESGKLCDVNANCNSTMCGSFNLTSLEQFAAQLTGAPLFANGSITRGIPRLKAAPVHYPEPNAMSSDYGQSGKQQTEQLAVTAKNVCIAATKPDQEDGEKVSQTHSHLNNSEVSEAACRKRTIKGDPVADSQHMSESEERTLIEPNSKRLKGVIEKDGASPGNVTRLPLVANGCVSEYLSTTEVFSGVSIAKSSPSVASFSRDLDSFMSEYVCQTSARTQGLLSCAYLSGEVVDKVTSASDNREIASQTLVPV